MSRVQEQFDQVVERIQKAARRSGREPQNIALVAVSKTVPVDQIVPFIKAGVRILGENRVQEAAVKFGDRAFLDIHPDVQLHLLGHLQSNKIRKAAGLFDMIQSLDRLETGDALNRHAGEMNRRLTCLVQVKISPEPAKEGLLPDRVLDFLARARGWTHLQIRGLMGIAPQTRTAEEARPYFAQLRRLFEQTGLDVLSMGMSQDFEVAIEEGSTMVRIGTALFGARA